MGALRDFGEPLDVELKRTRRLQGGAGGRPGRFEEGKVSLTSAALRKVALVALRSPASLGTPSLGYRKTLG